MEYHHSDVVYCSVMRCRNCAHRGDRCLRESVCTILRKQGLNGRLCAYFVVSASPGKRGDVVSIPSNSHHSYKHVCSYILVKTAGKVGTGKICTTLSHIGTPALHMADASLENTNREANAVKHHHKRTDSLKMIR